jgi:anti-sigma B factor antagonist
MLERDMQIHRFGAHAQNPASAQLSPDQSHRELVSLDRPVYESDVLPPPAGQPDMLRIEEVIVLQQDQIHSERSRVRPPSRERTPFVIVDGHRHPEMAADIICGMDIGVRKADDITIVDFNGRLAAGVSDTILPRIIGEILDAGSKKILLNLSDMDYIDSNGLGELVQVYRESQRRGASLRLLKPQDRVAKTLRLTNLLPMFPVYDTEEEALGAFAS